MSLYSLLKKIYKFIIPDPIEGCNGSCEQGKIPCDCGKYGAPEKKIRNFEILTGAPENKKLKKRV
jgi:hypothetical protein